MFFNAVFCIHFNNVKLQEINIFNSNWILTDYNANETYIYQIKRYEDVRCLPYLRPLMQSFSHNRLLSTKKMSIQSSENQNTNAAPKFTEDDAKKSRKPQEPEKEPKKRKISLEELKKIQEAKPLDISITKGIAELKLGEKK